MNKLIGTYRSLSYNFELKIEISPNHSELYIFKKIDSEGNENILFEKFLSPGTLGSLFFWGNGTEISHDTDFNTISIIKAPVLGLTDKFQRVN